MIRDNSYDDCPSNDFDPSPRHWNDPQPECAGDGHYLCEDCKWFSNSAKANLYGDDAVADEKE